ncbi:DNA-directed RNA polymerase epsilon subunit [Halococcus morrhuae DSM 1307]|uniref:DNA-directed RNA polymerase epsilon subunit n=1 Tax=Halococcus morrhuae DSM 1307 TaxID=931277 RepID=M0MFE7_HALMO|nr:hypothetical protein [Halococcus morrhuae]EMA44452.1 DNA-directed RNA polymerase epsilon subunit [Halococcus morrhuae DSM 1307]
MNSYSHYESPAATQIGESGDEYDQFREINEGRHNSDGELPVRQGQWDKKHITEIFCSRLGVTEFQKGGVMDAMEALDFSQFGSQRAVETVALGVIRYVVNKDRLERNPEATWVSHEDQFQELMESCNVTMSDLTTVKRIALNQIPNLQAGGSTPKRDPNLPHGSTRSRSDEWWETHLESHYEDLDEEDWHSVPDGVIEAIPEKYRDWIPDSRLEDSVLHKACRLSASET